MFDAPAFLLNSPMVPPPPGVTSHPTSTSSEQVWYNICMPLFTVIPGLFLVAHLYTKIKVLRIVQCADYFIMVSFLVFLIEVGFARMAIRHGLGVHIWDLRLRDLMRLLFWVNLIEAFYCPCIFLIKSAIVLQYLHILVPLRKGNKFMYYGGWSTIVIMFIFYAIDMPLRLLFCSPREKIWNPTYSGGSCRGDSELLIVASSIFNVVTDLIVLLLPVRAVCKLEITVKKKIVISCHFATGLLATIAAAMRLSHALELRKKENYHDPTYIMAWMGLWGYAEIALGVIVACGLHLPRLYRALIIKMTPKTTSSSSRLRDLCEEHGILKTTEIVQVPLTLTPTSSEGSFVNPGGVSMGNRLPALDFRV